MKHTYINSKQATSVHQINEFNQSMQDLHSLLKQAKQMINCRNVEYNKTIRKTNRSRSDSKRERSLSKNIKKNKRYE